MALSFNPQDQQEQLFLLLVTVLMLVFTDVWLSLFHLSSTNVYVFVCECVHMYTVPPEPGVEDPLELEL